MNERILPPDLAVLTEQNQMLRNRLAEEAQRCLRNGQRALAAEADLAEAQAAREEAVQRIDELQDKLRPIDDVRRERDEFMDALRLLRPHVEDLKAAKGELQIALAERDSIQHREIAAAQAEFNAMRDRAIEAEAKAEVAVQQMLAYSDAEVLMRRERDALRESIIGCDHDGAYDLVTTHGAADDLCETPWSWCPKCGTLWDAGVQRDPSIISQALQALEGSAEG